MRPRSRNRRASLKQSCFRTGWSRPSSLSPRFPDPTRTPTPDPGRDQFHAIAMQAVGSALTGGHGGLGIAAMVAKHLQAQAAHKDAAKARRYGNKGLTGRSHSDQTIGYPKGDKMKIGLKFFLELPIKQLRGIAGDHI